MHRLAILGLLSLTSPALAAPPAEPPDFKLGFYPGMEPNSTLAAPPTGPPDFKVAFWFRRNDPLNTFHFQIYDVRKGEYRPEAVEGWLARMKRDFPGNTAYVKDVRVTPGEEARKKVAEIVIAEHIATGGPYTGMGLHGQNDSLFGGTLRMLSPSPDLERRREASRFSESPGSSRPSLGLPGNRGGYVSPPVSSSPFPYPYPKPHP